MKKIKILVMMFLMIFALASCSQSQKETGLSYPLTVTDSLEREITINKEPERIVSLSPLMTETVATLGGAEKLVGRTTFCDYPESINSVQDIGDIYSLNVETIVSLKPDLILASDFISEELVNQFESLNIPVVIIYSGKNLDEAYHGIELVASIINKSTEGEEIVASLKKQVGAIEDKVKVATTKPRVYYVVGFGPGGDFTAGGNTFIGQLITLAGGENIAESLDGWAYSVEKVVAEDPDIILMSEHAGSIEEFSQQPGYKDLRAVKDGAIYFVDDNLVNRAGPRLGLGLEELASKIHPELFK